MNLLKCDLSHTTKSFWISYHTTGPIKLYILIDSLNPLSAKDYTVKGSIEAAKGVEAVPNEF